LLGKMLIVAALANLTPTQPSAAVTRNASNVLDFLIKY